ncbi:tetratricopeptide repeat protein [Aliarcobacter skirrowii]|uniref:tetratricopeptide repeat protein n=1 Tax=Aliarcobacter skirrowii TaxID=28200 RepID=UPI0029A9AC82|nr:tetratricopeptide repeat protein [Aliarcobacter skirrowii]MDX4050418.1 tetratricopeptide repeat protein [Aliarcobacter skirrowii]
MSISNDDLKPIVDELYKSNFYAAVNLIKELENKFGELEEICMIYYFTYYLMEWTAKHYQSESLDEYTENKTLYFNKVNKNNNKSNAYLQLYLFLEENFRIFDYLTWFGKKDKSINLLENALKENPDNLKAKFYLLLENNKIKDCFLFLLENNLDKTLVENFIYNQARYLKNNIRFEKILKAIFEKYNFSNTKLEFYLNLYSYNFSKLYEYYKSNPAEKEYPYFNSYVKTCYELEKYDELINFIVNLENENKKDYFILGQAYEKIGKKEKAIEAYFKSSPSRVGDDFDKLFNLKAYEKIKEKIEINRHTIHKELYDFYEAKILYIEKEYDKSLEILINIINKIENNGWLEKNIYLILISIYYHLVIDKLKKIYLDILNDNNFELRGFFFDLNYKKFSDYQNLEKYGEKLNIEYKEKYSKKIEQYKKLIYNKYIKIHKLLYKEIKKLNFKLTEDKELYYLSFFDDSISINKEIEIYQNRLENEPENPNYYLSLGNIYFKSKNFTEAKKCYEKSIELSKKYFLNLNGQAELSLLKMDINSKDKNKLFDESMLNFISYNSYQRDTILMFFEQILYKYQNFSINSLSSLTENYLYFASPNKLNDPFDVASLSLEKQFENLEINKERFKTCSLSKINDNKLMWSHYAKEHTGICIGYKFLYLPNYIGKEKVLYKDTNIPEKDIFKSIMDYWRIKSEDWEYEQEIRLLHYGEKGKINYTFDKNEAFQKNIIGLQIVSISFGLRFKEFNIIKPIIKEIERKQKTKIDIFQAKTIEQKLILEKILNF